MLQHQVDYVILCCRQIAPSSLSKQHIFDFYQQCLSYCQASSIDDDDDDDDDEEMNNIQTVALGNYNYFSIVSINILLSYTNKLFHTLFHNYFFIKFINQSLFKFIIGEITF